MMIKKLVYLVFAAGAVFLIASLAMADSEATVRINEVLPDGGDGCDGKECVELYNIGDEKMDLDGWVIKDKADNKIEIEEKDILSEGYEAISWDKSILNNSDDTIYLINPDGEVIDEIDYKDFNKGENKDKKSYSFNEIDESWQWTEFLTLGEENKFEDDNIDDLEDGSDEDDGNSDDDAKDDENIDEEEKENYEGLRINEILPNPEGNDNGKEYIEIFNTTNREIDLSGCILRDASKNGKSGIEDGEVIEPKDFWLVYQTEFTLNNGGDEVKLFSPDGQLIDSMSYHESSKEDVSYNFSEDGWKWSTLLTPGQENEFSKKTEISKVEIEKKIYENISAQFDVKASNPEGRDLKFIWEFGDGKKSYVASPKHTYSEKGKYQVRVTVNDGVEKVEKVFRIEVKKYPRRKVNIIALMPNPEGTDTDNEWIEIKNKYKKKLNLKGWSIAAGSSKKTLTNHPIKEDFIIKSGKAEKIYHENAAFSLGNKQGYIELRYPDGRVASKVNYNKKDGAKENEIYMKIRDSGWVWVGGKVKTKLNNDGKSIEDKTEEDSGEILEVNNWIEDDLEEDEFLGGMSEIFGKKYLTLNYGLPNFYFPSEFDILNNESILEGEIKIMKKPGFFVRLGEKLDDIFGLS